MTFSAVSPACCKYLARLSFVLLENGVSQGDNVDGLNGEGFVSNGCLYVKGDSLKSQSSPSKPTPFPQWNDGGEER